MRFFLAAFLLSAVLLAPALADPVFTGNVLKDFADPDTQVFPDPGGKDVGMPVPPFNEQNISGWDLNATYFYYNKSSDILYVGMDFYIIGGDADGDGDPSHTSSKLASKGGVDWPNLTEEESICMTFDPNFDGLNDIVVGISGFAARNEFGTYHFVGNKNAPALGFGTIFDPDPSVLYCIPNATCPDFEFYITHYSRLPGCNFTSGESFKFKTVAFAGSLADDGIGEDISRATVYYNYSDFGDAPASYGTLTADQGAVHLVVHGLHLGTLIDDDDDGQPDSTAMGDDLSGLDDEDGVIFGPLYTGNPCNITVNALINVSSQGRLNAWMDFNGDGDWSDPDEHIFVDNILVNGSNNLTFNIPSAANPGATFARFRLSTIGGLSSGGMAPDGSIPDGEVEDYQVTIEKSASIGNLVWKDINKNGLQDPGEPGLPGVPVELFRSNGEPVGNNTADADGHYGFKDLVPGEYYLIFHMPQNFTIGPMDQGNDDALDSDADVVSGRTDNTSLASGEDDQSWDAGLYVDANINVTKTAIPDAGAPLTNIDFTINVTNTGNVTLDPVMVEDTIPEGLSYVSDNRSGSRSGMVVTWTDLGPMPPGKSEVIQLTVRVDGGIFGRLTNRVNVTGKPPSWYPVNSSTKANVTAIEPNIEVSKIARPDSGAPSTKIEFSIKVTNSGNVTLNVVEAKDTLPQGLSYVSDNQSGSVSGKIVNWPDLGSLGPGESRFIGLVAHVDGDVFGKLTNLVNVTGYWPLSRSLSPSGNSITNSTTTDVIAFRPNIEVSKTARPDSGAPSTRIEFAIKVTNSGNITLNPVEATDTLPQGLSYVSDNRSGIISGRAVTWDNLGPLGPGESRFIGLVAHVDGDIFGNLTNLVNVTGRPPTGNSVTNSTTTNVTALHPRVEVNKTAIPDSGAPSTNIEFTIKVVNTGNVMLNVVEAKDTLPQGLSYVSDNRSGIVSDKTITWNNLGSLEPGEFGFIGLVAHIDGTVFGKLTNIVNVTSKPPTGNNVTNKTTTNVTVFRPNIEVIKTAQPDSGAPSTKIEFAIKVTNSGNITLNPVEATDTLPQGLSYVSDNQSGSVSGRAVTWDNLGPLGPGESRFIGLVAHVDGDIFGNLTNLVNVTGRPPTGNSVTNSTTTNVTALHPRVEVNKTAIPDSGAPSTNIEFTIRVANTGNVMLNIVEAKDTLPQGLSYVSDNRSGIVSDKTITWNNLGSLAPGEFGFIGLVAHIDGTVFGKLTNTVNVTSKPPTGNNVTNKTTTNVTAFRPNIEVIKIARPDSGSPSTKIEFAIKVTNTGNITLNPVEATDTLPQGLSYVSDNQSGDVSGKAVTWNNLGQLSPGESRFIGLVAHVDGEAFGNLTNLVNVTGRPPTGNSVTNLTTTNVTAFRPNIEVTKTPIPDSDTSPTDVTFPIRVTNSGNVVLNPVVAKDTLIYGLSYVSDNRSGIVSGNTITWNDLGPLAPGEFRFISLVAHVGKGISNTTNRVDVTGTPPTGKNVTNSTKVDKPFEPAYSILGRKFNDLNGNGTHDGDPDPGLPGWEIELIDEFGELVATAVTNESGLYQIDTVYNGNYTVREVNQPGWKQTCPAQGYYNITVDNSDVNEMDFGNQEVHSIFGRKFNDLNGNGTHDGDPDPGIPGWEIELVNETTGQVVRSIITNESGLYQMDDVPRGNYIVREVQQPGWLQTCPAQGYYEITVDHSDVNEMDFGNQEVHSILGRKFNDLNGNGTHDGDPDPGIPGWEIELVNETTGQVVRSIITNESGLYQIDNVPIGNYTVREVNQPGWHQTCPAQGYYNITVEHSDVNEMDFGNQEVHSIFGRKFNDLNGNGTHDGDPDPGIPGWEIELVNETTGQVVRSIITNESGLYQMDDVPRGNYIVREVQQPSWLQTCPAQGYYEITVDHSDVNEMDFGNQRIGATLGDFVWLDINMNGIQDPGESGIPGVVVKLYRYDEGNISGSNEKDLRQSRGIYLDETETNSTGNYRFTGISEGSYYLEFELPSGRHCCGCNLGSNDEIDCDADDCGITEAFTLQYGQTDLSWDAGILAIPGINVTKVANPTSASPGAEIGFDINISNNGENALSQVNAVDLLPPGMSYVSDNRSGSVSGRNISWINLDNLDPGASIAIHLVGMIDRNVSGILVNEVDVNATDPAENVLNGSAIARVLSLIPEIDVVKTYEPVQYGQYCETKTVKGTGAIESRTDVVDKKIALEYNNALAGEGEIELESTQAMSEAASKLQRDVPSLDSNNSSSLNLIEETKLNFAGSEPLTGEKSIHSKAFHGGSGAKIQEAFSADTIEKGETVFFGSNANETSPQTVGMDLKSSFNGTVETDSGIHKILSKDIRSRQMFSGKFEVDKMIKFHENTTGTEPKVGCEGIDC